MKNRVIKTEGKVELDKKTSLEKDGSSRHLEMHKTAKIFKHYDDVVEGADFSKSMTVKRKRLEVGK